MKYTSLKINNEDDYKVEIEENGSDVTLTFTRSEHSSYVSIHYYVNDDKENQQNIELQGNNGTWIHTIKDLEKDSHLYYSYTYKKLVDVGYDTKFIKYEIGAS
ncbi:hypothetical protein [Chengkuizengella sediminis]|uniref:hypothetical protein n=1 Tax=Chengkuizengella sediminis TaxID=1885917 RepID=UPI00138A4E24|nr:hypothetical protein [Chengkuizengella sediminis]NDI35178.1 hypothetical protein [Chengkuizengella sediminis]